MRHFFLGTLIVIIASFGMPHAALALTANGGYCESSAQCESGYCHGDSGGFGGTCQTRGTGTNTGGSAVSGGTNIGTVLVNPLKSGTSLESFLGEILGFVIRIGTIAVILMLVYVGYRFVVAQGKPGEIEEAKKMLLWTIIGALVLLGAQAIAAAIKATVTSLGG